MSQPQFPLNVPSDMPGAGTGIVLSPESGSPVQTLQDDLRSPSIDETHRPEYMQAIQQQTILNKNHY